MDLLSLADHCRYTSKPDGTGLSFKLVQVVNLLGAKSATVQGVAHTLSGDDVRIKVDIYKGANGKDWGASATNLYDSSTGTGIAGGAFSGSVVDVTGFALGLVEITISGINGAAQTLKQIEMSLWLSMKPF